MRRDELSWFSGQLPVIGPVRQAALLASQAAVIGLGRIGTSAALALHAAGVGKLVLIDPQRLEDEQIGPMWFLRRDQIGTPKVRAVADLLRDRPYGRVEPVLSTAEAPETADIIRRSGIVLSCANTISARLKTERNAIAHGVPVVQAAAFDGRERLGGIVTVRLPETPDRACFGCLAADSGAIQRGEGLLTTVTSLLGVLAAHLATLIISSPHGGIPDRSIFVLNGSTGTVEALTVRRRPDCPICGAPA